MIFSSSSTPNTTLWIAAPRAHVLGTKYYFDFFVKKRYFLFAWVKNII
jgi:hypothetical protein